MKKRRLYTENDYIQRCKELNDIYIGNHKNERHDTIIEYICNAHKEKGIQTCDWGHFRVQKKSCPYCSGRYKTTDDIIPLIKNKNVELISDYIGNEKPITCKCKECGNVWTTLPKVLITNGSGCPKCGKLNAQKSRRKTHEKFICDLKAVNPDIEIIGQYNGTHKKIQCRCKIDNTIWYGYPANLLNRSAGCPACKMSNHEKEMLMILKRLGLNIISQYSIDECRYKSKLKFDAFDQDNNIAFEYNGEQHYRPVDFAGNGEKWAIQQFELTKNRDIAKMDFCKQHKIPVVVIPYWERDNMESFIISKLKEIKKGKV